MADKADFNDERRRAESCFEAQLHQRGHRQRRGSLLGRLSVPRSSLLQGQQSTAGVGERLITLNVNGQQRRVDVMKQETLASTLRYKLGPHRHQAGMRPRRMRLLHRPDRRYSALFLFGAHPHGARPESRDDRRPGKRRRNLASGAAGCHRRTGLSVCVLYARLHYDCRGISENQSQSHPPGVGARHVGKPVPLPGLRQDSDRDDARR